MAVHVRAVHAVQVLDRQRPVGQGDDGVVAGRPDPVPRLLVGQVDVHRPVVAAADQVRTVAERVLGVRGDVAARRAIALFRESVSVKALLENGLVTTAARSHTEDALSEVARSGDKPRASQAETLLAVMTFGDLAPTTVSPFPQTPTPTSPDQAEAAIKNASMRCSLSCGHARGCLARTTLRRSRSTCV